MTVNSDLRHDWGIAEVLALHALPFNDLLLRAHNIYRQYHDPNTIQLATLYSIKTGACPEDCAYCPQSARYKTGIDIERLKTVEDVVAAAAAAKKNGATRFCMGAGWRSPKDKDMPQIIDMVKAVRSLGMETCVTLGMLSQKQVDQFEEAELDFYNHNLDSSPEFYESIISTRDYQDRLDTLEKVRNSSIKVCCGGIIGMGETTVDRIGLLCQLANMPEHPESVPINLLIRIKGTPLENKASVDPLEFVRVIALARILMPQSIVRLSAGRKEMSDELQALCLFAGANSMFYGDKYLVTDLPNQQQDRQLIEKLGIAIQC